MYPRLFTGQQTPTSRPRISRWSVAVLLASLVGIYFVLPQLKQLRSSIPVLEHAVPWWIAAGLLMSGLSFFVAAYAQYVAGDYRGTFRKITILQLTGAFINHFVPFNFGSSGLTARYYYTLGQPRVRSVALSMIPMTFGIITNVTVIALLSPLTIGHVAQHTLGHWYIAVAGAFAALVFIALYVLPPVRRRLKVFVREAASGFGSLKPRSQLPGLVIGSLALSATFAVALLFSVYAAHASIGVIDAFTIFVTMAVVQNAAPTPGGLGASEAFLVFGLTSVGVQLPQAVAATLLFRLITFWIPIIPGILALREVGRWGLFV